MEEIVKSYLLYVVFFGVLLEVALLAAVIYLLAEQRRVQSDLSHSFSIFSVAVESLIAKITPLLEDRIAALEKTKECPQCKKRIDEAYGACPFCSYQFTKKYLVSVIGPADEKELDLAAEKLSTVLKSDFHEMKHRLRMGFEYAIADHAKRHEFMNFVEKLGCSAREVLKWV